MIRSDWCQVLRVIRDGRERPAVEYVFNFAEERLQGLCTVRLSCDLVDYLLTAAISWGEMVLERTRLLEVILYLAKRSGAIS